MRDINDDMDDLFRRAADKYPLNTNSSDWNKVQSAMQLSEKEVQVKSKKNYRRFLWLLLLLPFAFVVEKYGFQNNDKGNSITQNDELASSEQKKDSQKDNYYVEPPKEKKKGFFRRIFGPKKEKD